jgi:hypothetical protein
MMRKDLTAVQRWDLNLEGYRAMRSLKLKEVDAIVSFPKSRDKIGDKVPFGLVSGELSNYALSHVLLL